MKKEPQIFTRTDNQDVPVNTDILDMLEQQEALGIREQTLRQYIRRVLKESAEKPIMMVPAKLLMSTAGEYRTEPKWRNFRAKTEEEQRTWAKSHFAGGIRTPVDVRIFSDGTFGFGDGHHRVKAAEILDEQIPIHITRNQLLEKSEELWLWWKDLVVNQGLHPKWDLNREGYNLRNLEDAKNLIGR
jgi:hypothetical protein